MLILDLFITGEKTKIFPIPGVILAFSMMFYGIIMVYMLFITLISVAQKSLLYSMRYIGIFYAIAKTMLIKIQWLTKK